jgi:CubicO group peptidase (beta-lactamase class C family)
MRIRLFVALLLLGLPSHAASVTDQAYWPTNGWRTSTPESQGMDSGALADAFDFIRQNHIPIHSFLIVRNGYIVLDAYVYPFRDGDMHDAASVTKSITSTLIGIAAGEHKLDIQQPVLSFFPGRTIANRDARKEKMTIEHLLTMTSGLDCHVENAEVTLRQMQQSKDWLQFMLDRPMTQDPGTTFSYCSGGMHLLSGIISQATGRSALEFARQELFEPLGIRSAIWPSDPQGRSRGWGDLHMQPRDMAKIGYLWLQHGRWEGRQIVPADWMDAATQAHAHPNFGSGEYGYGFWVYPKRTPPEFEALGRGGQRISIAPDRNIVVVFTGGDFEPGDVGKFIGQAIKSDHPLPENPTATARLTSAVTAAAAPPSEPPLRVAAAISGKSYAIDANPMGLSSIAIAFPSENEAVLQFGFTDGRTEKRPIGTDGVPRLSPAGRYGLPVALRGWWETNRTFVFDYDEVANINSYRYRLTFNGDDLAIELSERTGLEKTTFHARPVRQ